MSRDIHKYNKTHGQLCIIDAHELVHYSKRPGIHVLEAYGEDTSEPRFLIGKTLDSIEGTIAARLKVEAAKTREHLLKISEQHNEIQDLKRELTYKNMAHNDATAEIARYKKALNNTQTSCAKMEKGLFEFRIALCRVRDEIGRARLNEIVDTDNDICSKL